MSRPLPGNTTMLGQYAITPSACSPAVRPLVHADAKWFASGASGGTA